MRDSEGVRDSGSGEIKDPTRNSLVGFLKRWENKNQLDKTFIQEAKALVSDGFDAVIELESGKIKPTTGSKQ